jgi:hypothetical protein
VDANPGTLIPSGKRNSLIAWFNLYMGIEAGDQDSNTFKAKQSDLSGFINYFRRVTGSDHPDRWRTCALVPRAVAGRRVH